MKSNSTASTSAAIRRISPGLTSALAVLTMVSCGGGGDRVAGPPAPVVPVPVATVATVTVAPGTVSLLVGESRALTVTLRDQAGIALTGRAISWTTSNAGVATISSNGATSAVTAGVGAGTATITATSETRSGSATVSVLTVSQASFASVITGGAHTCALTAQGAAYCWGRGERGQLGATPTASCEIDGSFFPCSPIPIPVAGGLTFVKLVAGGAHTCGLTGDGTAYCWGGNSNGTLGDNSTANRTAPAPVATEFKFASLDAGAYHTCGLTSAGAAYCWGANDRGQLADGTTLVRTSPVAVTGGLVFQFINAGGFTYGHTCAVTVTGKPYCWGDNERGQLGIGSSDLAAHAAPLPVSGTLEFQMLTAGLGRHTCGLTSAGAAYCWGENSFGALGNGSSDQSVPTAVSGGITFSRVVAGGYIGHTCGLVSSGTAYCWGDNEVGALGDGTSTDRLVPTPVAGGLAWSSIDAGYRHTCARASTGTVYCWGSGRAGQLGINSQNSSNVPVRVIGQP